MDCCMRAAVAAGFETYRRRACGPAQRECDR
jgi:hypothetical protein